MNLGFIGVGRIARNMVQGLREGAGPHERIFLSPRGRHTASELAATYEDVVVCESNQQVIDSADVVFLSVRPEVAAEVLGGLRFSKNHLLISLVALFSLEKLKTLSAAGTIVRAAPIPSMKIRQSPTPIFPDEPRGRAIFDRLGTALVVADESALNSLMAVSSLIKPTYLLMGEVARWASDQGLPYDLAARYVVGQYYSTIGMAAGNPGELLQTLARGAATPGGLNEQATNLLTGAGMLESFTSTLDSVLERLLRDECGLSSNGGARHD